MAKSKRDIETNKEISVICIVVLSIILIIFIFILIIFMFSKTEVEKKITSIDTQIETLNYENGELDDKIEEYNSLIADASDASLYMSNLRKEYEKLLPEIEKDVKKSDSINKIVYLNITVTKGNHLDEVLTILSNNNIITNFYSNDSELLDKITNSYHEVGLYINSEDTLETIYEDKKEIIDKYNMNLFIYDDVSNEEDIVVNDLKQVKENSTSEEKKQLTSDAYANNIIMTTANRSFLIIKLDADNAVAVNALQSIISGLKEKGYIFLPLISKSSIFE